MPVLNGISLLYYFKCTDKIEHVQLKVDVIKQSEVHNKNYYPNYLNMSC